MTNEQKGAFDKDFNDTYITATSELNAGPYSGTYEILEPGKAILINRRKELGYTQQMVADMARIKLPQYQRFEHGERSMASASLRIGMAICDVLQLDPHRFVRYISDAENH